MRSPGDLKGIHVPSRGGAAPGGVGGGGNGPGSSQLGSSSCFKSIELDQSNELSSSVSKFEISSGISDMSNKLPVLEDVNPIFSLLGEALSAWSRTLGASMAAWLQGQVTVWMHSGAVAPGWRSLNVQDLVAILVACCQSTGRRR